MDSNGDGTGDLVGITNRLDYLQWRGVDAIWISPIFPSPMADFGYDVADYTDVDALFGTRDDLQKLIDAAHARDIRVLLDYVPNHSSDRHPWFLESRGSIDNPKRDWYLWYSAREDGSPPNNWLSVFGGSAWEWDDATRQFYYHAYLKEQPDLNWRNPAVRTAMLDVLRFWFDRGIDGFRIDALRQVFKDSQLRDNPPNPTWTAAQPPYESLLPIYTTDQPELLDLVAEFRDIADAYPERVLIGELWLPIERLMAYYGVDGRGLHLPFNFHLILTAWNAPDIAALIERYEAALPPGAWPNWVLSNHDRSRIATRVGTPQARVAAMLLLTLRGTPTMYQGDEIGMHDVPIPLEAIQDPVERRLPGLGRGRDPERTPMQWDDSTNAGFSRGRPWLPLAEDYATVNVAAQKQDPRSTLALYRGLIGMRRATPALAFGDYRTLHGDDTMLVYERLANDARVVVALNFSERERRLPESAGSLPVKLSTHLDRVDEPARVLRPHEGLVLG
jgi:alpha-glucosidase